MAQTIMTLVSIEVKCGTSLTCWENKGWINFLDPYCWFQCYIKYWLGRRSLDDKRQIAKDVIILFYLKLDKFYCIGAMN